RVAAGEQRDQRVVDDAGLAEDDAADARAHVAHALAPRLDRGDHRLGGFDGGEELGLGCAHVAVSLVITVPKQFAGRDRRTMTEPIPPGAPPPGASAPRADAAAPVGDRRGASSGLTSICGEFPIGIAPGGTWYYHGSPIGRKPLVRLFASVLRRAEDGAFLLVTPVE